MPVITNISMRELRKQFPPNKYSYNNMSVAVENGKTIVRYVEIEELPTPRKAPILPCEKAVKNFILEEVDNIIDVVSVHRLVKGFLVIVLIPNDRGNSLITKKYYVDNHSLKIYEVVS